MDPVTTEAPTDDELNRTTEKTMIGIKTIEHAIASVAHDIVAGAKKVNAALVKAAAVVKADAPTIEALTSLVDPRAATIERIGAALIGEVIPQVQTVTSTVGAEATAPSYTLSAEMIAEIKQLIEALGPDLAAAKASAATPAAA